MREFRGVFYGVIAGAVLWLMIIVSCRAMASETTAVYIQQMQTPSLIIKRGAGIAWCVGCPEVASQLGATYWYGCCDVCPPANDDRVAIIRPNWEWSSDCPADYVGYILAGNEQEFSSLTPGQMAAWLVDLRAAYPEAVLVCLNSYDMQYVADTLALLPDGICEYVGVHIYDHVDVDSHLDTACTDCLFWITEMGRCANGRDAASEFYETVQQARALARVELILFYTAVDGVHPCLNGLDENGELTDIGAAWVNAITTPVPEEAYP